MNQAAIRVDFYVHETAGFDALARTACRIAEKAFQQAQRVYIHTDSADTARLLDERLWTFRDRSFVPHALAGTDSAAPVLIGHGSAPDGDLELLINMTPQVPDFYIRCHRIADLVDGEDSRRAEGRERFRFYREHGLKPEAHKL
jgi:DNA polymerase III subunit chi